MVFVSSVPNWRWPPEQFERKALQLSEENCLHDEGMDLTALDEVHAERFELVGERNAVRFPGATALPTKGRSAGPNVPGLNS